MKLLSTLNILVSERKGTFLLIFGSWWFEKNPVHLLHSINIFYKQRRLINDGARGSEGMPHHGLWLSVSAFQKLLRVCMEEAVATIILYSLKEISTLLPLVQRMTNTVLKGIKGDRAENLNSSWKDRSWRGICLKVKTHWMHRGSKV